ncbi:MAG: hypothetical protein ACFE9I_18610 [Candidatus Hermodarchaeota archaeon]
MKCPNCEAVLSDESNNFCEFCGFELNLKLEENSKSLTQEKTRRISRRRCC